MRYSILFLAVTRQFSRYAAPVKTLLQRSALMTLGMAAALATTTIATPAAKASPQTLTALSFELDSAPSSSLPPASGTLPEALPEASPKTLEASETAIAATPFPSTSSPMETDGATGIETIPGTNQANRDGASAQTGVLQSYAGSSERVLVQPTQRQPAIAIATPQPAIAQVTSLLAQAMANKSSRISPNPAPYQPAPSQPSHSSAHSSAHSLGANSPAADPIPAQWWEQGSDSPIAVAIGNAEGTRQPNGGKNAAYYWHQDPGNGADNFGTFSYQHFSPDRTQAVQAEASGAGKREVAAAQSLPEIADQEQMQRLQNFYQQLQQQAADSGITLTPLEILNGLDLINQSEAAGLSKGGYIDRLVKMRALEDDPDEQIKEARSWAYWHPERKTWDAPGLGNGYANVRRDQDRRFEAVKQAMAAYIPNGATLIAQSPVQSPAQNKPVGNASKATPEMAPEIASVSEESLLTTAAKMAQAETLSFGLSKVVAIANQMF
jgi:hypothetical protein